jgi:hypothetical protein
MFQWRLSHRRLRRIFWLIDPLLSGGYVKSGRCLVTPATYKHATIE